MERGGEQGSSGWLVLRFLLGTAEMTRERLVAALRVLEQSSAEQPQSWLPLAPRHVLLGALSAAPAGLRSAAARARPLAERSGRMASRGLQSLARIPGGQRVQAACHDARVRTLAQLARWAVAGQREEAEARSLARTALPELFELAMSRLADSPDLQELLQEQSQGLTAAAMERLREQSRGADQAAQRLASRLLRRRRAARAALARP
jgi:hypothetical protein